jgi:aminopeptidase N
MTGQAMTTDELLSTQAIRLPVTTKEAIAASFDGEITYLKGAAVLRMFEASVGPAKWQAFLRGYLTAHRHGNATADDFLGAMRADLGADTADGFASFLGQSGLPRIEATLRADGARGFLVLSQRRSLPAGVEEPGAPRAWKVPVCVRYGDGKTSHRACALLERSTSATAEVPLETAHLPSWVLLNAGATGYYRSAVAPSIVRELFTPASPSARQARLTVAERLMLVADVRGAAQRGELDVEAMLRLAPLVAADADERVAGEALLLTAIRADALEDRWYEKTKRYNLQTFGPTARRLGWKRAGGDSDDRHSLRQQVVPMSALAGDAQLAREGAALARAWLTDPAKAGLSDDLVDDALAVAAKTGDAALFERVLTAARQAPARNARARLLAALGGFTEPGLVDRALALVAGTEFDLRETSRVVLRLLAHRETRAQTWRWLGPNLDGVLARMRSDEASSFLGAIAGRFCDEQRRGEVAALLVPRAETIDGARSAVARGLEETDRCIARLARDRPALERFLATVR